MVTLKDFVSALQAGWFPALAALVGSSIVLVGDYFNWPYLSSSPELVVNTAAVVGVFSFSVLIANIAYVPVKIWQYIRKKRARQRFRERCLKELEEAPNPEIAILSYLVSARRRAFVAEIDDSRLTPLVTKGLIVRRSGQHSILRWPYYVPQVVWDILIENRERLLMDVPPNAKDPFSF